MNENPGFSVELTSYSLDFEIEIGIGSGREYPLSVIRSPSGEAHEIMHFPYDELALETRLKSLEIALLHSGGSRRQVFSTEGQAVQDFGRQLFNTLICGEIRSRYDMSRETARQNGKGLRIKLRIQAPELANLPWEFLYDHREAEYVCLSRDTPIVRYIEIPQSIQPLSVTPPLQILGMVTSPSDLAVLDVVREKQRVETALKDLRARNLVNLVWLEGQTWRDLQRAMRGGPWHIFHFIGHGGFEKKADEGVIALSDERGSVHMLLATEIGRLLADHRSLRLVILNSCEGARGSEKDIFSSTASILVRRGMPAVLAMQYAITDRAAIEFSRAFYEALADGLPVDVSMCEARKAVSLAVSNTLEWGTPVLYMRSPQGVIFNFHDSQKTVYSEAPIRLETNKEVAQKLERLYTDGLAAFWIEDWEKACHCFQEILAENPVNTEASNKLEAARRQWRYSTLYQSAVEAYHNGDLGKATSALEELIKDNPDYKDTKEQLQQIGKQKYLNDLYTEAIRLQQAGQWKAVINILSQISHHQSDYPDLNRLRETAEKEIEIIQHQEKIHNLYSVAVREMDSQNWQAALEVLREIRDNGGDYLETIKLIERCENEITRLNREKQIKDKVDTLYEQANRLFVAKQWTSAINKILEIKKLQDQFEDPEKIEESAHKELEREVNEIQKQTEIAGLYSVAVKLLREGKYQEALEQWNEVKNRDPKYPDRQKVQTIAKRQLVALSQPKIIQKKLFKPVPVVIILICLVGVIGIFIGFQRGIFHKTFSSQENKPSQTNGFETTKVILNTGSGEVTFTSPIIATATEQVIKFNNVLYDDFTNQIYDGSYDNTRWRGILQSPAGPQISQRNGRLEIDVAPNKQVALEVLNKWLVENGAYVEAKINLDPAENNVNGEMFIELDVDDTSYICKVVILLSGERAIICLSKKIGTPAISNFFIEAIQTGWHNIGFTIDPISQSIYLIVDGCKTYQFSIEKPFDRKSAKLGFSMGVVNEDKLSSVFALIDYVKIGVADDDPFLYDDFSGDRYDLILWEKFPAVPPYVDVSQQNGIVEITSSTHDNNLGLEPIAYKYLPVEGKMFYEVMVRQEPSSRGTVWLNLNSHREWAIVCGINYINGPQYLFCSFDNLFRPVDERTTFIFAKEIRYGSWHFIRAEVDTDEWLFHFYGDGEYLGSYTPTDQERDKMANKYIIPALLVGNFTTETITGYFDDFRVGKMNSISDK